MTSLRQRMMEDLRLRNMSPKTEKAYIAAVSMLARYYGRSPDKISEEAVRQFLLHMVEERQVSFSYYNQTLCALRFFYTTTLGREWNIRRLPYAKHVPGLPVVYSRARVALFMSALPSLRYEAIFGAIYGCGLRLVESTRLRAKDIDSERHLVHVVKGKGQKDRYVMLPGKLLRILREYYAQDWPNGEWLFPGQALGKPINGTSIQRAARKASAKVGITPVVTARNLRHTFATHLHEQGVDIRTIQMILGHRSIQTTTVYTHLSKEKLQSTESPFDLLPSVP